MLDTGSGVSGIVLYRTTGERLKLRLGASEIRSSDQLRVILTEPYTVELPGWGIGSGLRLTGPLGIIDGSSAQREDGLVPWPLISHRITAFDASIGKFQLLRKLPKEVSSWTKLNVLKDAPGRDLELQIPSSDGSYGVLAVDTGAIGAMLGVVLHPTYWNAWKTMNPDQPRSVILGSGLALERTVQEAAWAEKLSLGSLQLTDVMVSEADSAFLKLQPQKYVGTLTFQALKRLDLIVDGEHGTAYVRAKRSAAFPPGTFHPCDVVFLPSAASTNVLAASVQPGNSAFDKGIRDGDLLLQIDQLDVKDWLLHPGVTWHFEPGQPFLLVSSNGGKPRNLELTLKRGDKVLKADLAENTIAIYSKPPGTTTP
jgi:hypothetical protein